MKKSLLATVIAGILCISYVATGAVAPVGPEMFVVIGMMLTPFIAAGLILYWIINGVTS
jgi:hypothetical protein